MKPKKALAKSKVSIPRNPPAPPPSFVQDMENADYGKDEGSDDESIPADAFSQANIVRPFKTNILNHLNGMLYCDTRKGRNVHLEAQIRKLAVNANLERFHLCDTKSRFERRITEISWHPKEHYLIGAACKGGDLLLMKGSYDRKGDFKFAQRLTSKGPGPGGAIFAIRFDETRRSMIYTAGLEGIVQSWDTERDAEPFYEFYNTRNYSHWFTSMDVSQPTRTILAGCTKGNVYLSTLDGEKVSEVRLHKGKVLHCEFNQKIPHLIVTSSIDKTVKLWDLRKLSENSPLTVLEHDRPVNVAHFNPLNSSRLLTSDQRYDVRVYDSPTWTKTTSIKHPHRQFQHLTAIVASWHPLSDIIVIGKYPVVPKGTKPAPPRPIQFFDADSGNLIHELFPPTNEIVSLNLFNPIGDVLASGQGRSLLFFDQQDPGEVLTKNLETLKRKKGAGADTLHFDRRRENSDSEDDENDADRKPKRKKMKTSTGGTKSKPQTRGNSKK